MSRLFFLVTTCDENIEYFELAINSLFANKINSEVVVMIVDFGQQPSKKIENMVKKPNIYVHRTGQGFCNNMNFGITMSLWLGYDYFGHANDDVIVQPDFFAKGIEFLKSRKEIGFVAGVQQETSMVTIPARLLRSAKMPMNSDRFEKIDDLRGKWGDFSAWIAKAEAIRAIRYLDEEFDKTGIIADNDWLLRLRLEGWECWRSYQMRYLHAKGITQRKYRPGWPEDEVTKKARAYYIAKWGADPWSDAKEPFFDKPFNREPEESKWD